MSERLFGQYFAAKWESVIVWRLRDFDFLLRDILSLDSVGLEWSDFWCYEE